MRLLIFFFLLSFSAQTIYGQTKARRIVTDLNNDAVSDTIVLSSSHRDSLSLDRVSISIAGFGKQVFKSKQSWVKVDSVFLAKNKNAVNSKWLFLSKTKKQAVILLFW